MQNGKLFWFRDGAASWEIHAQTWRYSGKSRNSKVETKKNSDVISSTALRRSTHFSPGLDPELFATLSRLGDLGVVSHPWDQYSDWMDTRNSVAASPWNTVDPSMALTTLWMFVHYRYWYWVIGGSQVMLWGDCLELFLWLNHSYIVASC